MFQKINLIDFLRLQKNNKLLTHKFLINIRGCNGAGKSTIPISMLNSDENSFELTWMVKGKERVIATVFPKYNFLALGHYHSKCGGMDSMKTTDEIKLAVDVLWNLDYNILMEGIMASTVRQTYIDLFNNLNESKEEKREIIIYNIIPSLKVCLDRIQLRNGGKEIKEELVASKLKTVTNNALKFKEAGFNSISVTNEDIEKDRTLDWFFNNINYQPNIKNKSISKLEPPKHTETYSHKIKEKVLQQELKKQQPQAPKQKVVKVKKEEPNNKILTKDRITTEQHADLYIEPIDNLRAYEWFEYYKEPDNTVIMSKKFLEKYWKFIYERLNIYHRRVVLSKPAPWTNDIYLQKGRFTNISRDMDKLTIYERNHIISKIDEPVIDLETRKKSVMFNIIMFRTFVKIETFELIGFIDFSDKNYRNQWEKAKKILLQRREEGLSNFTGVYIVNQLKSCNPDPETNKNKTMNALCMLEYYMNNIDDIYRIIIKEPLNMKEQLARLQELNGVGHFTAYEYACSFAMICRYFKNTLVPWTEDNYTNVGPGAERGLDWIFLNRGNLTYLECIIYLRSIWKAEFKRLGWYDEFVVKLPKELNGDLDLRVIEHCLCETSKYNRVSEQGGKFKMNFIPETKNMKELIMK